MKNALIYNYNIYVDDLVFLNDNYYFKFQNNDYVVSSFTRNINEAISIYKLNIDMLNKNFITYRIVLTKDNNILFIYNDIYYILMIIPKIKNRLITLNDILNFNYEVYDKDILKLDKSNWSYYWENKIDYIEEQFYLVKLKYPVINNTIDYYIGLWENGISYFNFNNLGMKQKKVIGHKRVGVNTDLYYFLNPINLLVDYKERDIGEYLKSYIYSKNWTIKDLDNFFDSLNLNKESVMLLITRILFPSYYFDMYEDIVLDNKDENMIKKVINNKNIIVLLKYLFNKYSSYNIPLIEWIKNEEEKSTNH